MSYCKDAYIDSLEKKLNKLEKKIMALSGCWFCKDSGLINTITADKEPSIRIVDGDKPYTQIIKYCPICGRRL